MHYHFIVQGQRYDNIASANYTFEAEARSVAAEFPVNGSTTVWYDPTDPNRSSVFRIGMEFLALPGGAAAVALIACLLCVWMGMGLFEQAKQLERGETKRAMGIGETESFKIH